MVDKDVYRLINSLITECVRLRDENARLQHSFEAMEKDHRNQVNYLREQLDKEIFKKDGNSHIVK